jgi:hypothetical protein
VSRAERPFGTPRRRELRADAELDPADQRGEAIATYRGILADPAAPHVARGAARVRMDSLLGLDRAATEPEAA